jgi:hypothetical protein
MSEYFLGVAMIVARVESGNPHFFMGTVTMAPSVWYFPAVFVLKETLPFLLLLLFTTFYTLYRIGKNILAEKASRSFTYFAHSFQNRPAQYLIFFFILLYSYLSITGKLNIGFRHLFPILPLLYMLIAKTVFDFLRRHKHDRVSKKLYSLILGGCVFSVMAIPVLAYPHYLSYFNIAAGGHLNGYNYVNDSNYDWGQDLDNLKRFIEAENRCKAGVAYSGDTAICTQTKDYPAIDKIRVDYFGGANAATTLGDFYTPWWAERDPEPGWYALSALFYQESIYKEKAPGARSYLWLQNVVPITRAGDSIFIYYIPPFAD